jgi:hypothetical protein
MFKNKSHLLDLLALNIYLCIYYNLNPFQRSVLAENVIYFMLSGVDAETKYTQTTALGGLVLEKCKQAR